MASTALFRRVAFLTALFAYLQIALGGVVRVTGSGLGCPDWPLCNGRPYPAADVHSIIEYSHRTVGAITGVLLITTVVLAWMGFRHQRPLAAWLATASLVAIAAEGALGGVVVVKELAPVAWATLGVLALQFAVGAAAALTGSALFNGLHVAIATLVWSGMLSIALLTLPRADRERSMSRLAVEKRPA